MPSYVVPSKSSSDTLTSLDYMRYIRENFRQGIPHIFTTKGDIAAGAEIRQAAKIAAGNDYELLIANNAADGGMQYSPMIGLIAFCPDADYVTGNSYVTFGNWITDDTAHSSTSYSGVLYDSGPPINTYDSHGFVNLTRSLDEIQIPSGLGGLYYIHYEVTKAEPPSADASTYDITLNIAGSITVTRNAYGKSTGIAGALTAAQISIVRLLSAGDSMKFRITHSDTSGAKSLRWAQVILAKIK